MTRSGDLALWTGITTTIEFIVAHPVAVETGRPVSYMRVWERLVVLGQGQIWGVRGARMVGDMALWTGVAMAVELIVAHPVAMETGCPVAYVRVWERLIVLGQGQIW